MTLWIQNKYMNLAQAKLLRFKKLKENHYGFRCPYCGDSKKDARKSRGYMYEYNNTLMFKCFNCACSTGFYRFLHDLDPSLAKEYSSEEFKSKLQAPEPTIVIPPKNIESGLSLESLNLPKISELADDHEAKRYLQSRKIPFEKLSDLYYCSDMRIFAKLKREYDGRLPKEQRIIIPFYDKVGNLSGVTGRAIDTNNKIRYMTLRLSDYPMIYGLNRVDFSKPIYICEGAFDSMFVDNAISVNGSDLKRVNPLISESDHIYVFDNQPRNKELVKIIERLVRFDPNAKIVIWPKDWKFKDINEAIISGVSKKDIAITLNTNTFTGLRLKLAIRDWKQ